MKQEYTGSILAVRSVEDTIRATKKYTKGAFSKAVTHPIQGEAFPSKMLTEYYEVYPDMEVGLDMSASDFMTWVWGETPHVDMRFLYDYRVNKGKVVVYGNNGVVNLLEEGIPGFAEALAKLKDENGKQTP